MSQNRTVVPGMEGTTPSVNEATNSFYSRETNSRAAANGTVVPGMNQFAPGTQPTQGAQQPYIKHSDRPVVGFLYSISRQGIGEYWPLYVGPNTIGSSPKCNVCLKEGTVSTEHAIIVVRKMKNPEKIVASINDARSTNGTMINGISLAFSAQECSNNDVITIGENYELVLILVDAKVLGLKVAQNFVPIKDQTQETDQFEQATISDSFPGAASANFDYNKNSNPYSPENYPSDGTVDMDGARPTISGGTVPM